jgi:hypothetical protein
MRHTCVRNGRSQFLTQHLPVAEACPTDHFERVCFEDPEDIGYALPTDEPLPSDAAQWHATLFRSPRMPERFG